MVRCYGGATVDTVFQVLSISKPVVALGALRLAHGGVLGLDVPVTDVLRSWSIPQPRCGGFDPQGITVRRILCHAAGLNIHGYDWRAPGAPRPTAAELLDGMGDPNNQLRIVGPPGGAALYSGGGYTLLQQVVEDATGRGFAAVMREAVLEPLGMTRSTFDDDDPILAGLAERHDAAGRPLGRARIAATASSGLHTTARDLTRFLAALQPGPRGEPPGRGLITPEMAAGMTGVQAVDAGGRGWSLGFYMLEYPAGKAFHHGGFKSGWWSQIDGVVGKGHTMVVMTNSDASDEHVKPIVGDLRQMLIRGSI